MAFEWQKRTLIVAGLLLGTGLCAWAVVAPRHPAAAQLAAASVPVAASQASGSLRCDLSPIVGRARSDDGQLALQAHPTGATAAEVAAQLLAGKEAVASGHQRDAEAAFLNACHSAEAVPGHDAVLVADADYQLARLYANLAITGGPHAGEMRQRAEQLYGASLQAYRTRYGAAHEKTRFAAQGLASLEQKMDGSGKGGTATSPVAQHRGPHPRETMAAVPLAHRLHRHPPVPAATDADADAENGQ